MVNIYKKKRKIGIAAFIGRMSKKRLYFPQETHSKHALSNW